jgi:peptidoglycan/xylan/chitin deacetylase (PgdA/CDA1 family)
LDFRTLIRRSMIGSMVGLGLDKLALWQHHVRTRRSRPRMVVVGMHGTPKRYEAQLRKQMEWVARNFTPISPDDLTPFWAQPRIVTRKPAILFTFDDGRESNYTVAAPLLEAMGARGVFFVVPDFVGRQGSAARDFYYTKIDIRGLSQSDAEEDWKPMSPEQLLDLSRRGHAIGNHTFSHANLGGLSDAELQHEIVESAETIATWVGKPVDYFAWPYSWDAIDRRAWDLVRQTHRFCFSPCPGTMDSATDSPHLIWRKEVEADYPPSEYRFMYSGLVDPVWAGQRRRLRLKTA